MPELTDDILLSMLRSADEKICDKALRSIYKNNYDIVANFVEKNSGNTADAADIFQDGVIALFEQVRNGSFKGDSTIRTYLYSICRNLWLKRLRKSSTKKETYGQEVDVVQEEDLVLDLMIAEESSEKLADLLGGLGANCQKILLLYYYERRRMKEIAKILNLANDQVAKNKKNRCLNKLKELAAQFPSFKSFFE